MPLLFDAHLDLAWNALSFNRDLRRSIGELRAAEAHMTDERCRGHATVSLPELRRAGVAVCVATLIARAGPQQTPRPAYGRTDLDYADATIADAVAQGQLAYYRTLERLGEVRIIDSADTLDDHWRRWAEATDDPASLPVGLILSMEGADPLLDADEALRWRRRAVRAIGPAHYGAARYAGGTSCHTGLTAEGVALLGRMAELGIVLDVTHLCDASFDHALDLFDGRLCASHHNCRALVPHERQLRDDQLRRLVERGAVIGVALHAWMLVPEYHFGRTPREAVTLDHVAQHIDHICQLAGDARHVGLGSDLDGGFGREQAPAELDTIADLHRLADPLAARGFTDADIAAIFAHNWRDFYRAALHDSDAPA